MRHNPSWLKIAMPCPARNEPSSVPSSPSAAVLWIASTGSPRRDSPQELGRRNHVYQRFAYERFAYRCSKGHFESIFQAVQQPDMEEAMIDSTSCKARQASSGAQKKSSIDWRLLRRAERQDPRRLRRLGQPGAV